MPVTAYFDFGDLGFSSIPKIRPWRFLDNRNAPDLELPSAKYVRPLAAFRRRAQVDDVVFDEIVPKDDADFFALNKRFSKPKGVGYPSFAFLIRVMNAVEIEILPFDRRRKKSPEFWPPVTTIMSFMPASTRSGSGKKSSAGHRPARDVCL